MRSALPKVLHRLAGKTMLEHVLDGLLSEGFVCPAVVVGYGAEHIERVTGARCRYIPQTEQLGTGHAGRVALDTLPAEVERVVLVYGDAPLIPAHAVRDMLELQRNTRVPVVLLTTRVADTRGFGRVIRDESNDPVALVEESDLLPEQHAIDEVNLGAYVFDAGFLRRCLPLLRPHLPKGEYYLTDVVAMSARDGTKAVALEIDGGVDVMGVNDLIQLEQASRTVYDRSHRRLMRNGVTIVNSASTFIDEDVRIAADSVILPFSLISGQSVIGTGCTIGPHATITASQIGDRCTVVASTVENSKIGDDVCIGPYAHLRAGAHVENGVEIGNYAEIKQSTIGAGTKIHHFSYLGDAEVGANVNIGAGTVTCNFDGMRKHRTVVEDDAFIGSDTMLRAPVTIGAGAFTGAGSVVTRDVPSGSVAAGVPARVIRRSVRSKTDSETERRK